jgi:thiamine-phosphate pyrophosphorylase
MLPGGPCQTGAVNERRQRLSDARLYLVCDGRDDEFLAAAIRGGVGIVQLRMKSATDDAILAAARRFARHDALVILNDRPDLAVAADADGVHVGQDDVSVDEAREIVGPDRLVGLSTHTPEQIDAAVAVDYIGVGPVYETPTKPGRPAAGVELVRYAAAHAPVPWFAIGGITAGKLRSSVAPAGATRVAVVRALTEADDPELAARTLRAALDRGQVPLGAT